MNKLDVKTEFKSGFISIVGQPNVGKSTLLNRIIDHKLAIVSPKPQTTRNRILGILHKQGAQLIFWDTPGFYRPKHALGKRMVNTAHQSLKQVDIVLFMMQVGRKMDEQADKNIIKILSRNKLPVFLIINKIDLINKSDLLPIIDHYKSLMEFAQIIPICAIDGAGVDTLIAELLKITPAGHQYFPRDMITDQPERFLTAELVREQIYRFTHQEIPYAAAVLVEELREATAKKPMYMRAVIYVEHDSQKKIIIGKAGAMLKQIGQAARMDMQEMFDSKVYLDLWVKVKKDWREKEGLLNVLGY